MSDSLWLHESQHARLPRPSPSPGVHSDSRPSSWWRHPAISSSAIPFSSRPQSLPASEFFPMSQLFAWGGQSTGVSALASFLPKNTQGWSLLEWMIEGYKRAYVCLLDESERGEWKVALKLNIQKTKIMASSQITSWQMDGETMETVTDFILGVSKITIDDDHSHEIKRRLLLGRKVMILDSILKSRDITLPTKIHLVKAMVFPVVIYGCESWTIKKAEHQEKNWCFWTEALEKILESLS